MTLKELRTQKEILNAQFERARNVCAGLRAKIFDLRQNCVRLRKEINEITRDRGGGPFTRQNYQSADCHSYIVQERWIDRQYLHLSSWNESVEQLSAKLKYEEQALGQIMAKREIVDDSITRLEQTIRRRQIKKFSEQTRQLHTLSSGGRGPNQMCRPGKC